MQTVKRVYRPSLAEKLFAKLGGGFPTPPRTRGRRWAALGIAVAADAVQILLFPLFTIVLPLNAVTDVIVALVLIKLLGWHIAFLPGFVIEQIPFIDLAPTWTAATLLAMRQPAKQTSSDAAPIYQS